MSPGRHAKTEIVFYRKPGITQPLRNWRFPPSDLYSWAEFQQANEEIDYMFLRDRLTWDESLRLFKLLPATFHYARGFVPEYPHPIPDAVLAELAFALEQLPFTGITLRTRLDQDDNWAIGAYTGAPIRIALIPLVHWGAEMSPDTQLAYYRG